MERREAVKQAVGKVAKWWAIGWTEFVRVNGHPVDRLVGPAPWERRDR